MPSTYSWFDANETSTSTSATFTVSGNYHVQAIPKPALVEKIPVVAAPMSHRRQTALLYFYRRSPGAGGGYDGSKHLVEVDFINVTDLMAKFFIKAWTEVKHVDNWRHYCIGLGSLMGSGLHMPMLDYDGKSQRTVTQHVRRLQKAFQLGPATLYSTKKGFHVYFTGTPVDWPTYNEILNQAKCDPKFQAMSQQNHMGVLRISAKYTQFDIKLVEVLEPKGPSRLARTLVYARIADTLIDFGRNCGTHIASIFPNQAKFKEDPEEWKAPRKKAASSAELAQTITFTYGHIRVRHHANNMLDIRRGDGTNYVYSFGGHGFSAARAEDAEAVIAYQQWLIKCLKKPKTNSINVGVIRALYALYWKLPASTRANLPPSAMPRVSPIPPSAGGNSIINAEYPDGSKVIASIKGGWVTAALQYFDVQKSYAGEPLPHFMTLIEGKLAPESNHSYASPAYSAPSIEMDTLTEDPPQADQESPGAIEDIGGGVAKCSYPDGSWVTFKIRSGWTEYSTVGQAIAYLREQARWSKNHPFPPDLELIDEVFITPPASAPSWYDDAPKPNALPQNFKIDYASLEKQVVMNGAPGWTGANWVDPKNTVKDNVVAKANKISYKYDSGVGLDQILHEMVAEKFQILKDKSEE